MSLHTSRAVVALKAMEKSELKELTDYVQSAFSKASPMLRKCFEYLASCEPHYEKRACNKELFSEKVLGKKLTLQTGKEINRLLSELMETIERFAVMKLAAEDPDMKQDVLMRWYSRKKLYLHLDKIFKETEQMLLQNKFNDLRGVYNVYVQQRINQSTIKGDRKGSFIANTYYGEMLKAFYEIEDLQNKIGLANLRNIMGKGLAEEARKSKQRNFMMPDWKNELHYYRKLLQFVVKPDVATYRFLLQCFDGNTLHISKYDKNRLLSILKNNIRNIFHDRESSEQSVAIGQRMFSIKNELYKGAITPNPYSDMINHLCYLNRVEEAEAFQKAIGNRIMGVEDTENFITAYRAQILFTKKQFADALKLVSMCKAEESLMGLDLRILKVRLAYELNDTAMLEAHVNTLRKFVATKVKKEMHPYYENSVLPLNIYLLRLAKLQPGDKELLQLKKEVAADKQVTCYYWLLEKVGEKMGKTQAKQGA